MLQRSTCLNAFTLLLGAIALGVLLGVTDPALAVRMKPLSELFIEALRLLVKPIVFCSVTVAIATMGSARQLGVIGVKTAIYFEVLALLTIGAGMGAAVLLQPGSQWPAAAGVASTALNTRHGSLPEVLGVAFTSNAMLQVLLASIMAGLVLGMLGQRAALPAACLQTGARWLFTLVGWTLKAAPVAAFGAMAWLVGYYGPESIGPLASLLLSLYGATLAVIIVLVSVIGRWTGVNLWQLFGYLREELLLVFSTASSVTAMPRLMEKLCELGCGRPVVSVVVPAGYSFNLTGSNIYLAMSLVFLAQVYRVELDAWRYASILLVLMITSKGASGVAGSAFIALAATLTVLPEVPLDGLAMLIGIERLLKCRALANIVGNAVACIAVAAWSGQFDRAVCSVAAERLCGVDRR